MAIGYQVPTITGFGTLGREIKEDVHENDLDAKIIITSHNSRPGLGKTTLAIRMAREFDAHGWDAQTKAFMDAAEYHNAYDDLSSGSCLLFDEIEGEADSRRAMSNKNVELSKAWAMNRYRNMITICTLPTVTMLDNRMLELSDYWINVMGRGLAHPYRVRVNDFNGRVYRERIDENGAIRFGDLPDDDPDYNLLKDMKDQRRRIDNEYYSPEEHQRIVEDKQKQSRMDERNKWIAGLVNETDYSSYKVADLPWVGLSQQRVNQIAKEH